MLRNKRAKLGHHFWNLQVAVQFFDGDWCLLILVFSDVIGKTDLPQPRFTCILVSSTIVEAASFLIKIRQTFSIFSSALLC